MHLSRAVSKLGPFEYSEYARWGCATLNVASMGKQTTFLLHQKIEKKTYCLFGESSITNFQNTVYILVSLVSGTRTSS